MYFTNPKSRKEENMKNMKKKIQMPKMNQPLIIQIQILKVK